MSLAFSNSCILFCFFDALSSLDNVLLFSPDIITDFYNFVLIFNYWALNLILGTDNLSFGCVKACSCSQQLGIEVAF